MTQEGVSIYALIDPRDGAVRYIGKANDAAERLKSHIRDSRHRKTPVYSWIRKLRSLGLVPDMKVLATCSESEWPKAERRAIRYQRWFNDRLLNVADGGNEPIPSRAGLAAAVVTMNAKRPTHIMRAYRMMECAIREASKSDPERAANYTIRYEAFKDAVGLARLGGYVNLIDDKLRLLEEAREARWKEVLAAFFDRQRAAATAKTALELQVGA